MPSVLPRTGRPLVVGTFWAGSVTNARPGSDAALAHPGCSDTWERRLGTDGNRGRGVAPRAISLSRADRAVNNRAARRRGYARGASSTSPIWGNSCGPWASRTPARATWPGVTRTRDDGGTRCRSVAGTKGDARQAGGPGGTVCLTSLLTGVDICGAARRSAATLSHPGDEGKRPNRIAYGGLLQLTQMDDMPRRRVVLPWTRRGTTDWPV